jgi:hypothetical protein
MNSYLFEVCGIMFDGNGLPPSDSKGCHLSIGHDGPHEFICDEGQTYRWETDFECDCDHCMTAEGDYCSLYWPVTSL